MGSAAPRDRDRAGRPRSNRPRDGLGRPLPRGETGVARQLEGRQLTPAQTIREAQRLLDGGMPFHAHEVFEDAWKSCPAEERELWRGLAQLAVGLTHEKRGNPRGADVLLRRGSDRVASYASIAPYGLDITRLVSWARASARAIRAGDVLSTMPHLRRSAPRD